MKRSALPLPALICAASICAAGYGGHPDSRSQPPSAQSRVKVAGAPSADSVHHAPTLRPKRPRINQPVIKSQSHHRASAGDRLNTNQGAGNGDHSIKSAIDGKRLADTNSAGVAQPGVERASHPRPLSQRDGAVSNSMQVRSPSLAAHYAPSSPGNRHRDANPAINGAVVNARSGSPGALNGTLINRRP